MKTDTIDRHYASVRRVLRHITVHLSERYSVAALSKVAHVAPFHFHRVFRNVTGEPIGRYIRRLRLDYSLYQLLFTKDSIVQIALQAGYQSHEAFTRAFERTHGLLPSVIRHKQEGPESEVEMRHNLRFWTSRSAETGSAPQTQVMHLPRRAVCYRSFFGAYEMVPSIWRRFAAQLTAAGIEPRSLEALGILYDDPVRYSEVRYDACVVLPDLCTLLPEVGIQVLPAVTCISKSYGGEHSLSFYSCARMMNAWITDGQAPRPFLPCYVLYQGIPFAASSDETHCQLCVGLAA